jgi:hypothetical protein
MAPGAVDGCGKKRQVELEAGHLAMLTAQRQVSAILLKAFERKDLYVTYIDL